jgi:hypothetical protein
VNDYVQRHLKTEEFYREIIAMIPEETIKAAGGETPIRGKLDAILSLGKIEGRLSALSDPMEPQSGHLWYRREEPDDVVEIESVGRDTRLDVHVMYRHTNPETCACGAPSHGIHARRGHASRALLEHFTEVYALQQAPPDRLIEDWMRIVEAP